MKTWIVVLMLFALPFVVSAQDDESEYDENYEFPETKTVDINLGLGLGVDYGMIGAKLSFVPVKQVAVFGSIGYGLIGPAYNFGATFRMLPEKKVCPYASLMYGVNTVVVWTDDSDNRKYHGVSISGGIELHRKNKPNFWNFGLLIPIRPAAYRAYIDDMKRQGDEFVEPSPVGITVGYHFAL
jgi:hypothetical protein